MKYQYCVALVFRKHNQIGNAYSVDHKLVLHQVEAVSEAEALGIGISLSADTTRAYDLSMRQVILIQQKEEDAQNS